MKRELFLALLLVIWLLFSFAVEMAVLTAAVCPVAAVVVGFDAMAVVAAAGAAADSVGDAARAISRGSALRSALSSVGSIGSFLVAEHHSTTRMT